MKKTACFLFLAFFISSALFAQDITRHFKIYDVKLQKTIQLDDLIANMGSVDVLFFGEEHNDSVGHYLETEIFKKMAHAFPGRMALTLEMFHTDVQGIVNEYLKGYITEKNFIREARAWNNYKDYRPMVEFAKANQLDVVAANASSRYSNAVSRSGLTILKSFPAASKSYFAPLPIDTATGRYHEKFMDLLGGHGMGTMKVYQTQNFWDATMAWSIASYLKKNKQKKAFHVNGKFHSDEKLGTYAKLAAYHPKLKMANISCFPANDFENPQWTSYHPLGDYIILTDPTVKKSY